MDIRRKLTRRSFFVTVAGSGVAAGALGLIGGPAGAVQQGCSDIDRGAGADPAGSGRRCRSTGVTDQDSGQGADPAGQGRGTGAGYTGLTDSDRGTGADRAGYGRHIQERGGPTDRDSGATADPARRGRGPGGQQTGISDADRGAQQDRAGYGRGTPRPGSPPSPPPPPTRPPPRSDADRALSCRRVRARFDELNAQIARQGGTPTIRQTQELLRLRASLADHCATVD